MSSNYPAVFRQFLSSARRIEIEEGGAWFPVRMVLTKAFDVVSYLR